MTYDYIQIVNQKLAEKLHLQVRKSDESTVIIGEPRDVELYKEVVNA